MVARIDYYISQKTRDYYWPKRKHGDEERKPAEPRFTSVRRHLAHLRKVVRVTSLINGLLTAWRIVAKEAKQQWRIEITDEDYSRTVHIVFEISRFNVETVHLSLLNVGEKRI